MSAPVSSDGVLRALTEDGTFRVITASTTDTSRACIAAQGVSGASASLVGELVTASVLVRESMAPDLRVQVILQSNAAKTRVIADAHPDGTCRALVQRGSDNPVLALHDGDFLQVARTLHNGALQQGTVAVSEGGGVRAALMEYMQMSEQVFTVSSVGVQWDDGVVAAGGYLVQLLPEVLDPSGPMHVMAERLKDFEAMEPVLARGVRDSKALLEELLHLLPHSVVGESKVRFGCQCNGERVALALSALPKPDIQDLLDEEGPTQLTCDYCGKTYNFSKSQLRGLLERN